MDFKPADIFSSRSTHSSNRLAVASLVLLVVVFPLDPRSVTGADATSCSAGRRIEPRCAKVAQRPENSGG